MRTPMLWLVPLCLWACDDDARDRDNADHDASTASDADIEADPDAEVDAAVTGDAGASDAASDVSADAGTPDGPPPPPEECNGEDEDGDGEIDEGVSNLCGGCGGIPPDGCQAWVVSAIQNADDILDPDLVVGFVGGALGFSEREIDGATCTFFRVPAQHPDAHLGLVNVDTPRAALNLVPVFRADRGTHAYRSSPALMPLELHDEGDVVEVRAGGGLAVGPFEMSAVAPARLQIAWEDARLEEVLDLARGERDDGLTFEWPAEAGGELRFFLGGSVPVFNVARRRYEVREHYELTALLADDGAFEIPADLLGGGAPDSSVRVFVERRVVKRLPQGPHAIEMRVGQRRTVFRNGILENDEPPGFRITAPSASERTITPGEPLAIEWEWPCAPGSDDCDKSEPVGIGPLSVNLLLRDLGELQLTQVECRVDDPASGGIVLPGDFTEQWPDTDADTRLLTLQWGLHRQSLPLPDRGVFTRSVSAQMWLLP